MPASASGRLAPRPNLPFIDVSCSPVQFHNRTPTSARNTDLSCLLTVTLYVLCLLQACAGFEFGETPGQVNHFGQVELTRCLLANVSRGVLVIGSVQSRLSVPFRSAYSASKHAVLVRN